MKKKVVFVVLGVWVFGVWGRWWCLSGCMERSVCVLLVSKCGSGDGSERSFGGRGLGCGFFWIWEESS